MKNLKSLTSFTSREFLNEGNKAKAKSPNKVNTIDVDLSGDESDIMDAIKSFNLKVKSNGANKGTGYDMTGKNKDILDYLQSDYYALDAEGVEDMYPELLEDEGTEVSEAMLGPTYLQDVRELIMNFGDDFQPNEIIKGAKPMEKELIKTVKLAIKDLVDYKKDELQESEGDVKLNEEDIELMPELANALGTIQMNWDRWKNGPMTEPSDIKPAAKELKGWITRWMKQNLK